MKNTTKFFIKTFVITSLILGTISVLVLLFVSPMSAIAGNNNSYNDFVYTPTSKDNLSIMNVIDGGEEFVFVKFDPRSGDIPVFTLPNETLVSLNGLKTKLGDVYTKRGYSATKSAIEQTFGFEVTNKWEMNKEDFDGIFKIFGDTYTDFPMDIITNKKTINKGKQHINSKMIEDILSTNELNEESPRICTALSIIYSNVINEKIGLILKQKDDVIEKNIMDFLDVGKNDISYYDFVARKQAIAFVAKLKEKPSLFIETSGKYEDDEFILTEGTKELIIKLFDKKLLRDNINN